MYTHTHTHTHTQIYIHTCIHIGGLDDARASVALFRSHQRSELEREVALVENYLAESLAEKSKRYAAVKIRQ
jgi:hypothetical protein